MNVGNGNKAAQFHFSEYINLIFGTVQRYNKCEELRELICTRKVLYLLLFEKEREKFTIHLNMLS
jgi:hypothetical protein